MTRHVHIELPAGGSGPAVVQVGGADIAGAIRNITIRAGVGEPTDVFLDLAATPITFEGQARLWVTDSVVDLLAEYGWTPPEHAERGPSGVTLAKPEPVGEPS